ncbi:MAG: glucose-6-phosphate isomerase, partial [Deltaproteobacteria bacterium]|nr:glucose-6-phosphate isomerase [Deltaproteobacteria bacterium]
ALGNPGDRLAPRFLDNTDPDGIDREMSRLQTEDALRETLVVVISKSGGTPETRNGMLEAKHAFERAGLAFAPRAVAVTQEGSALDQLAIREGWIARFPMWDWVGGRTSETSAVGLLPAALQGLDVEAMLAGARDCDEATRDRDLRRNPAALLALCWLHATEGRGARAMVVLPYKDRLALFSRYLQQLVMESLGKERDLAGNVVHQGLTVYGNKGSTDQHAYVQQLRDGVESFFATFIEVRRDRDGAAFEIEPGVTSGDYLDAFLHATRRALWERGRQSVTLSISRLDARAMGVLIALFERAVGLYASLVGINAYHQPGVEAGKKAATELLSLQRALLAALRERPGETMTADDWSSVIGSPGSAEDCAKVLEHLAANGRVRRSADPLPWEARFGL